jgi:hypothetical protein
MKHHDQDITTRTAVWVCGSTGIQPAGCDLP